MGTLPTRCPELAMQIEQCGIHRRSNRRASRASARGPTYRGADKSLARPGGKQAAPIKSVMGREIDYLAMVGTGGGLLLMW